MGASLRVLIAAVGFSAPADTQTTPPISAPPPGNYQVTVIATGTLPYLPTRRLINNAGQVIVNGPSHAYLWNPISPNATVGELTDTGAFPPPAAPSCSAPFRPRGIASDDQLKLRLTLCWAA